MKLYVDRTTLTEIAYVSGDCTGSPNGVWIEVDEKDTITNSWGHRFVRTKAKKKGRYKIKS